MIKAIFLTLSMAVSCVGATLTPAQQSKIADAIYRLEGGAKASKPYGVLSVKVANEREARKVCINTINNNYQRWQKQSKESNFLDFLANKYCPPSADRVGNRNWKRNIKLILGALESAKLTRKQE